MDIEPILTPWVIQILELASNGAVRHKRLKTLIYGNYFFQSSKNFRIMEKEELLHLGIHLLSLRNNRFLFHKVMLKI